MALSANWIVNSTSENYAELMRKINNGFILTRGAMELVYEYLGVAFENEFSKSVYKHAGVKGGSANIGGNQNAVLALAGFSELLTG